MSPFSRIGRAIDRLYAWLGAHPGWIGVAWSAWQGYSAHNGGMVAAAFAYYTLFSLFPLILFAIAVSSFFVSPATAEQLILETVRNDLPAAGALIQRNVQNVLRARGPLSLLAMLTFLWSASGVFGTIMLAADRAWRVDVRRPFWQSRLLLLALTGVAGSFLALSLFSPVILGLLQTVDGNARLDSVGTMRGVTSVISLVLGIVTFAIIYKVAPNTHVPWLAVLPGAVLVGISWELGREIFALYLRSGLARFNLVYGSLGAVITLLVWAYLNGVVVVFGAELNAAIGRRRARDQRPVEEMGVPWG